MNRRKKALTVARPDAPGGAGRDPSHRCARVVSVAVLMVFLSSTTCFAGAGVKNVIMMVPDGCNADIQTLARWYKGAPLALDGIYTGALKTFMADSVITDSAAAATALACGYKTSNGFVGVGPRTDTLLSTLAPPAAAPPYAPLPTVLEGAKLLGKAVGLVATSRITHATPAAFAAHTHSRSLENEIMEQMVYQGLDVVFGGGKRHLVPIAQGGKREDREDLLRVLHERGYRFVETAAEMEGLTSGKVWGLFAGSHMSAHADRSEFGPFEPSLAEMTRKALELLSQQPDGFFLLVEGSQVDWAGHSHDPLYMVTEFLAFDDAVREALRFARRDGDTLLVAAPDHATGGLSIGNSRTDGRYPSVTVEDLLAPLRGMKITSFGLARKIGSDRSPANIQRRIREWWGMDAEDADIREILAGIVAGESLDAAIARVISRNHTVFGWTTRGHTGGDVPLWSYGPHRMVGLLDNTELAFGVAKAFGFDLKDIGERLFVDAFLPFRSATLDPTDPANPVLRIHGAEMPCSKNILIVGRMTYLLEGIVVCAPQIGKAYIPLQAVDLLQGSGRLPGIAAAEDSGMHGVERTIRSGAGFCMSSPQP